MSYKLIASIAFVLFCIAGAFVIPTFAGKHYGELKMIEADIVLGTGAGIAVTDSSGIKCYIDGMLVYQDNKIYLPEYHGTFPLYLPETLAPIQVIITRSHPKTLRSRITIQPS